MRSFLLLSALFCLALCVSAQSSALSGTTLGSRPISSIISSVISSITGSSTVKSSSSAPASSPVGSSRSSMASMSSTPVVASNPLTSLPATLNPTGTGGAQASLPIAATGVASSATSASSAATKPTNSACNAIRAANWISTAYYVKPNATMVRVLFADTVPAVSSIIGLQVHWSGIGTNNQPIVMSLQSDSTNAGGALIWTADLPITWKDVNALVDNANMDTTAKTNTNSYTAPMDIQPMFNIWFTVNAQGQCDTAIQSIKLPYITEAQLNAEVTDMNAMIEQAMAKMSGQVLNLQPTFDTKSVDLLLNTALFNVSSFWLPGHGIYHVVVDRSDLGVMINDVQLTAGMSLASMIWLGPKPVTAYPLPYNVTDNAGGVNTDPAAAAAALGLSTPVASATGAGMPMSATGVAASATGAAMMNSTMPTITDSTIFMATCEFTFLGSQLDQVVDAVLTSGLVISGIHDHFVGEMPRVNHMHVAGEGDWKTLSAAIGRVLTITKQAQSLPAGAAAGTPVTTTTTTTPTTTTPTTGSAGTTTTTPVTTTPVYATSPITTTTTTPSTTVGATVGTPSATATTYPNMNSMGGAMRRLLQATTGTTATTATTTATSTTALPTTTQVVGSSSAVLTGTLPTPASTFVVNALTDQQMFMDTVMGATGMAMANGDVIYQSGRDICLNGARAGAEWGVAAEITFNALAVKGNLANAAVQNVAVAGMLPCVEAEIPGVLVALRKGGLSASAIVTHYAGDSPRMLFVHFFGEGALPTLLATSRSVQSMCSANVLSGTETCANQATLAERSIFQA